MKIELFTVCDFAADYAGKLSVIGVFDTIFAKVPPIVHPHWCVAMKLRFEKIEEGQKRFRLTISDADGKSVIPAIDAQIVANVPGNHTSATVNFVANIGGVKFDNFGEYSLDIAIDGRHEGSAPLFIRRMQ